MIANINLWQQMLTIVNKCKQKLTNVKNFDHHKQMLININKYSLTSTNVKRMEINGNKY